MKKIRIGNDIVIKWRITINGEEVNLEGLDLSLYISTTYQPRKAIAFTVAGNEITATYKGAEQKVTGVYRLTLYRNEGENAQSILDACDAFELVSCSCLTTDVAFGGAEVELPVADLGIGVPGLSAYEIALSEGFEGTQEEWLASLSAASEAAAAECREFTDAAKIDERERQNNEALRVTAENERAANEIARQSAEATRETAERSRATAESQRVSAEKSRVAAEQQRADAEAARAEEFATFEGKIATKEDTANKVTSIGADADDHHYPSAKAVWSALHRSYMEVVFKEDTTVTIDGIERTYPKCQKVKIYDIQSVVKIARLPVSYIDCTHLDTSKWTSLRGMFAYNKAVTCKIDNLDTSNVTDLSYLAMGSYFLHELEVGGFDTRKVTNMIYALTDTTRIRYINVGGWDTSKVTKMGALFAGCGAVYYDLSRWDLSSCVDIGLMFFENTKAEEIVFGEGFGKCAATNPVLDLSYCENYKYAVESLCNMYDRAANGMSTMTIKLHANTKALLTEEQLNTLTSKGYTVI